MASRFDAGALLILGIIEHYYTVVVGHIVVMYFLHNILVTVLEFAKFLDLGTHALVGPVKSVASCC